MPWLDFVLYAGVRISCLCLYIAAGTGQRVLLGFRDQESELAQLPLIHYRHLLVLVGLACLCFDAGTTQRVFTGFRDHQRQFILSINS